MYRRDSPEAPSGEADCMVDLAAAAGLMPLTKYAFRLYPTKPYASIAFRIPPVVGRSLRMASTLPRLPVFEAIASHEPKSPAVVHCSSGRRFTYGGLLNDVADAKSKLRSAAGDTAVEGQRIAFLVENGYDYVGANQAAIAYGDLLIEQ